MTLTKLNEIPTFWPDIFAAHADDTGEAVRGKAAVLERYMKAVVGYLNDAVRDRHLADDLAQEFAYRFLRGDFQAADPDRGKFRSFLKTILRNQVIDHYRKHQRSAAVVQELLIPDNQPNADANLDQLFRDNWRKEILRQTWLNFEAANHHGSKRFCMILKARVDHPDFTSEELAETISEELGEKVRADWVRQNLKRAREKFASMLRREVSLTLETDEPDEVDAEMASLNLKKYCV